MINEDKEQLFNYLVVTLMPGIFHEINNNFCIIDGIGMIVTRKKDDEKISAIRNHLNNFSDSNKSMKEKLKNAVMLLSDPELKFPLDFDTIVNVIETNVKIQLFKNLNTELNCKSSENGLIKGKIIEIIYSIIIAILWISDNYREKCEILLETEIDGEVGRLILNVFTDEEFGDFNLLSDFFKQMIDDSDGKIKNKEFSGNEFGYILEFPIMEEKLCLKK